MPSYIVTCVEGRLNRRGCQWHKVPGPFGPSEQPTSFVMKIVPGDGRKPSLPAAK
jgi:hypothetical protein